MTDYDILCDWCHQYPPQQPGSWLCDQCRDRIHEHLHAILGSDTTPGLATELETELTKRARKGGSDGRATSPTPPLPYNADASACIDRLRWALLAACQVMLIDSLPPVANTIPDLATWLLQHEDTLAMRSGSGRAAEAIDEQIRAARRIIDTPPERSTYLGICDACDTPMRSTRTVGSHRCQCGLTYDIEECAQAQRDRLSDPDLNVSLAEAVVILGVQHATLRQRIKRGQIKPIMGSGKGAWYRIGDLSA